MESDQIHINMTVSEVIDKLSLATGHHSFKVSAPLSGGIKNNIIRVTLPPGFNYPCQPVLTAEVIQQNTGCNISYSFVPPYLGILSIATLWLVVFTLFSSDINKVILGSGVLVVVGVICLLLRHADKNKLIKRVLSQLNDKNV